MSGSWASSRVRSATPWRPGARRARAWLAALALGLILPAAALAGSAADTGRVTRVRVGDGAILIKRAGQDEESRPYRRARTGGRVDIGPTHVRIGGNLPESVDVDVPNVHISGHNITVNGEPTGLVRVFDDVHVLPGQRVDGDAISVFGTVTVEGHVTGSAVSVLGSVRLKPGAVVDGDAVAVGGGLYQTPGTTVHGETVSIGFQAPPSLGAPTLATMLVTIIVGWLITVFMAWLLHLLFRERLVRTGVAAARRSGVSILVGLLSAPLVVIGMLLLTVTVIGIPVAILLPFAYGLTVWAGQLAATYLLGCKLMRRRPGEAAALGPMIAGSAFVALFFAAAAVLSGPPGYIRSLALFFCLLGVLLVTGLSILGTGALLVSRFGSPSRDGGAAPAPAPLMPPAPAAAATEA